MKTHESRARGKATGNAFEDWIRERIGQNRKNQKGKIALTDSCFFNVDCAIPSVDKPETVIEIKITTDIQQCLMLHGLLKMLKKRNDKSRLGFVVLYEPGERLVGRRHLLDELKRDSNSDFDYFIIEKRWSKEINELSNWCRIKQ